MLFRRTSGRSVQCQALAGSGNASAGCPALKACLIEAMASGAVFAHDAHETPFESAQDEAAIAAFFALIHIGAFTFWTSGTTLVYDALGQELTTDYGRRGQLFALKGFFDLSGGLCGMLVQLVVYGLYPTDTLTAATVTTLVVMAYVLFAWVLLLWGVAERKAADTAERPAGATPQGGVPFTAAVIRMLRSPPYRWYLLMKIPTTFLGRLPFQLLLLFFQNTMRMEAFSSLYLYTSVVALLGGFLSIPLQLRLSQRIGRKKTLTVLLSILSTVFLLASVVPFSDYPNLLFPVAFCLGVCLTLPSTIPNAMLGDIIDYDELLTGTRSEAMFTTVEANIDAGIEHIVLTAVQLCMALAGYTALGGCECGCGVSCKKLGYDHARWVCPDSVGYTCADPDDNIGSALLFGEEPEQAPCSVQNVGVYWVTTFAMFTIPGIAGLLAIPASYRAVITRTQFDTILSGVAALGANPQAEVPDPLVGGMVQRSSNTPLAVLTDHFTTAEWARYAQGGAAAGMRRLRRYLGGRLLMWMLLFCGLLTADVFLARERGVFSVASETLLQISGSLLTVFVLGVPLDLLRFKAACQAAGSGVVASEVPTAGSEEAVRTRTPSHASGWLARARYARRAGRWWPSTSPIMPLGVAAARLAPTSSTSASSANAVADHNYHL